MQLLVGAAQLLQRGLVLLGEGLQLLPRVAQLAVDLCRDAVRAGAALPAGAGPDLAGPSP